MPRFCLTLFALCCLYFLSAWVPSVQAITSTEDQAFLQPKLVPPTWNTDPLKVVFEPEEGKCRRAYGNEWEERCFAAMSRGTAPEGGIVLRGASLPAGKWRWEDYRTLTFTPDSGWQPGSAFTVDMSALPLPPRVVLAQRTLKGSVLPLAGISAAPQVWIDPSISGPRAVSFSLRFTAPPGKDWEKNVLLRSAGAPLSLGKTQIIMGQDGTSCLIKVPLTALPNDETVLHLEVRGVRSLELTETQQRLRPGNLLQQVAVPSKRNLFRISQATLDQQRTKDLTLEYHLSLKTSLRVPASDLLKALKVVQLPLLQNPEATMPYQWKVAPAITQADLDKGQTLPVTLVKDPGASGEPIIVRVPATPGSFVFCQLPAGFGPGGYTLATDWSSVFKLQDAQGKVDFLQPGNVLTLTPGADNRLDIMTTGVDEVRWRATRIRHESLNLLNLFTSFDQWSEVYQGLDMISTTAEGNIALSAAKDEALSPRFGSIRLVELMQGGTGFLNVEILGLHKGKQVAQQSRLVLATDMGMVSKLLPDGGRQVFVCSLSKGQPIKDVLVRILGTNGQAVAEASTDKDGYARLPSVRGLTREKKPVGLVALRTQAGQTDLAWMGLDDTSRRVDYSRFPTQGQISSPDNINVYVFGQRGIFRPGETLRFGLVVRRGDWKPLPPDMPLQATLTDPAGRIVLRHQLTVAEGLGEVNWPSSEYAPTGRYRLDVSAPQAAHASPSSPPTSIMGSGAVRVEEFQADTLAIRAELMDKDRAGKSTQAAPKGWLRTPDKDSPSSSPASVASLDVHLRNFYGLPAQGHKVRVALAVSPATLSFAGFTDFTFPDILPLSEQADSTSTQNTMEALTNDEGKATVHLPLSTYQNRTMRCSVLVEGFEADGGRAVSTDQSFLVSPLAVMLGYRPWGAVGPLSFVPQGTRGGLEFVALNPDLHPANPGQLHLSVAQRRYVTVLSSDAQGKYVYEESPTDKELFGGTISMDPATGRFSWDMPTDKPGEFLLTVRDAAKTILARIPYTVAGNDDMRPALKAQASELASTQLRLRLDKEDYAPGDTVNIFLAAPYEGAGLLTLERDTVAAHVWFKAPAGHSMHKITIPKDFEGRGYINVTMGRAITSPEIFMQPHSYALVPLTVNAAGRDMGLRVEAPHEALPGSTLKAKLTAKHAGKALIFAVDEGVLQLTRFTTPDPLRYLLLDRALEVNTDQLYDLLMPVHAQIGKRLTAFGGDMASPGGRFHNPFKRRNEPPLAWWSGLVDIGPQGTEIAIPLPDYASGQIRLMAVGLSSNTVGSAQTSTLVRAPLVMTMQLPLMAAPGDVFEGGVSLHNTTDTPLNLRLQVEDTNLTLQKDSKGLPKKVHLPAGKEVFLPLRCVAPAIAGEATLTVVAQNEQGTDFRRRASLSVRPPVLPRQDVQTGFASFAGQSTIPAQPLTRALSPFKAQTSLSVSAAPLPPLRVLLRSLAAYPYGCVEQSISRALPLVLLQRRPGLTALLTPPIMDGKTRTEIYAQTLDQAMTAIRTSFRDDRGMASWPDAEDTSTLLLAYAADYALSLHEAGLALPGNLLSPMLETLHYAVASTPSTLAMAREKAYGLWVLTRAGYVTAHLLDSLCENLNQYWPGWEKDVTGSLLAGSYARMNMHGPAQALLQGGGQGLLLSGGITGLMTKQAAYALHVTVLARHFPHLLHDQAETLANRLLDDVSAMQASTFATAQGARALLELMAPPAAPTNTTAAAETTTTTAAKIIASTTLTQVQISCLAYQTGFAAQPAAQPRKATDEPSSFANLPPDLLTLDAPGCTQFGLNMPGTIPLYWEVSSDGYDLEPPRQAATKGMEVQRSLWLPDGSPLGPDAIVPQGVVLRVEVSTRVHNSPQDTPVPVVLADLLPGGFELVLAHPQDVLPDSENSSAYTRLDRREDRIVAHTAVGQEARVFVYHMRAVNRGRYVLPAVYGEGLYDRSINGHSAAGSITVQ